MSKDNFIIGIHYAHDATICLMRDGKILEVMSEERLSRQKKHWGFPIKSLNYIKQKYNIVNFDKVFVVGDQKYMTGGIFVTEEQNVLGRKNPEIPKRYLRSLGFRFPILGKIIDIRDFFIYKKAFYNQDKKTVEYLKNIFPEQKIIFVNHHLAHAYAAVPFFTNHEKRIVITLDGVGDGLCGSVNMYEKGKMEIISRIDFSASIGLLYSAVVDLLGMSRNEHEFKVMGLAPYAKVSSGEKVYEKLKKLVWVNEEKLTLESAIPLHKATEYLIANEFSNYRFDSLAYGIQKVCEEIMVGLVKAAIKKTSITQVGIGGGVFMNVKGNQKINELKEISDFAVTPSCGDESLAIGAAVYGFLQDNKCNNLQKVENIYWGSEYTDQEIKKEIDTFLFTHKVDIQYFDPMQGKKIETVVADILAKNSVVGRLKGRAEWGARALGNRSILANPSSRDNVKLINEMIKNRDFWMPFATSILEERADMYLHRKNKFYAPFMAITFETKEDAHKRLEAALHPYDLTSRPQMVTKEANADYHFLISEFEKITGIGGVLNTSFNLHGEPNVESPYDALRTFDLSGLPHVAIGNYLISKVY